MIKIFGIFILLLNCQINKNPSLKLIYTLASSTNVSAVTLTSLIPDSGALSPSFSETNFSYTMSAGNTTSTISFTPSSNSGNTITVNGSAVTSGATSSAINLSVGTNTITIVVTASDGTQGTYTIVVTRANALGNNDLSALTISSGTLSPVFAAATTSYTVSIVNSVTSVTVTPTVSDPLATITVNAVTNASGVASGSLAMSVGANVVTIVVTAQDMTTKTYTITVTRAVNSNNDLSALTISSGTLSPVFAAATTSYTVSVVNSVTSITVTPTASDATATITVNTVANTSGVASGSLAMSVGANVVTIVVTAQDASTKTYTITVTRAASSNNDLSALTISSGTLSPVFAAATTSYTVSIVNTVASLTVTPTASDATATITVNAVANTSGVASGSLAMSVGANVVTIVVTAQDTTTKTYTITVTRLNAGVKRIFVTSSTYTGSLGGITGADTKCNADTNKPADGSTYKAILVDGTNREACSTSNCSGGSGEHINWVLSATTSYVRASDSVALFTTNANAIFVFGTMSNSFQSGSQVKYWTGFSNATIWGSSGTICSSFTSTGGSGRVGLSDQTNYTSLRDTATSPNCTASHNLLCAEQ